MIIRGRGGWEGRACVSAKGCYVPTSLTTPSLLASQVFFWVAGLGSAILIDAQVSRLGCCAGRKSCWAGAVVMVSSERGGGLGGCGCVVGAKGYMRGPSSRSRKEGFCSAWTLERGYWMVGTCLVGGVRQSRRAASLICRQRVWHPFSNPNPPKPVRKVLFAGSTGTGA